MTEHMSILKTIKTIRNITLCKDITVVSTVDGINIDLRPTQPIVSFIDSDCNAFTDYWEDDEKGMRNRLADIRATDSIYVIDTVLSCFISYIEMADI